MSAKEVYVTYSPDSEEHINKVNSLTSHLRGEAFSTENDIFLSQKESAADFHKMQHQSITDYEKVIIVLSKGYKEKAEKFKGLVGKGYNLITKDIENSPNKYILVSFGAVRDEIVPLSFKNRHILDLSKVENLNALYAKLKDEDIFEFSEIGKKKSKNRASTKPYSIKYIKSLRRKVYKAYSVYNERDEEKISYLDDVSNSDRNLFLKQLTEDLNTELSLVKRIKTKDLISILFNDHKLVYSTYIIDNLELFNQQINPPKVRSKYLSKKGWAIILGISILFLTFGSIMFNKNHNNEELSDNKRNQFVPTSEKFIPGDSTKYRIVVLPFKSFQNDNYKLDHGEFITRRLNFLNQRDSLNIKAVYLRNLKLQYLDPEYIDRIREIYNANQIIYGEYGEECGAGDKVCCNYITDGSESNLTFYSLENVQNTADQFRNASLSQLGEGFLQEEIDYILYWNAMIASIRSHNYRMGQKYSRLLPSPQKEDSASIYYMRAYMHFMASEDYFCFKSLDTAFKYIDYQEKIQESDMYQLAGYMFMQSYMFENASYNLNGAIALGDSSINTFEYVYFANEHYENYERNKKLVLAFEKIYGKNLYFDYLYALAEAESWSLSKTEADEFANKVGQENYLKLLDCKLGVERLLSEIIQLKHYVINRRVKGESEKLYPNDSLYNLRDQEMCLMLEELMDSFQRYDITYTTHSKQALSEVGYLLDISDSSDLIYSFNFYRYDFENKEPVYFNQGLVIPDTHHSGMLNTDRNLYARPTIMPYTRTTIPIIHIELFDDTAIYSLKLLKVQNRYK